MEEYRIQGSKHATRSERRTHLDELDHPPVDCGCGPDTVGLGMFNTFTKN